MSTPHPLDALLPHRAPMILLDRARSASATAAECEVTVREGAMFVEAGRVSSVVFLEYMAQAAAVVAGARARMAGEAVRVGYLLGAREMTLLVDEARVGDVLTVRATLDYDDGAMAAYLTEVRGANDRLLASAQLNVYLGGEAPP